MTKLSLVGAAVVLVTLGVGAASAEPFNPVTGYGNSATGYGDTYNAPTYRGEGRAAAEDRYNGVSVGNPNLEQFREGK